MALRVGWQDVSDTKFGINYPISDLVAGINKRIPIPYLSLSVPELGNLGVDAVVNLSGNLNAFSIKLGLDACGKILIKTECGSDLTKKLPVWILDKAFDFAGAC
jgi:hypothetical protein